MVVTDRPSTCTANSEQDFTAWPSSRTVHAPHWLVSQPTCVPVSPSSSRRKWTSNIRGSTSRVAAAPFTWIVMEDTMNPLPGAGGRPRRGSGVSTRWRTGQHAPRRDRGGTPYAMPCQPRSWHGIAYGVPLEPRRAGLLDFERLHDPLPVLLRQLQAGLARVLLVAHAELGLLDGHALDVERLAPGRDLGEPDQHRVAVTSRRVDDQVLAGHLEGHLVGGDGAQLRPGLLALRPGAVGVRERAEEGKRGFDVRPRSIRLRGGRRVRSGGGRLGLGRGIGGRSLRAGNARGEQDAQQ